MRIRIGTRGSKLARWQADWVAAELVARSIDVEITTIETKGDVNLDSIPQLSAQGVFTREIQRALLENQVDVAVHSLKDLPTESCDGLSLSTVPERATIDDALISREGTTLQELVAGSRIGTSSVRRRAQVLAMRADLQVESIRGNVDTRLKKLDKGEYDALVLAAAGLHRLGLSDRIHQVLPKPQFLPAVGQGALGLETRSDDSATRDVLHRLDHAETHAAVSAERALLATLRAGCSAPVAAWARLEDGALQLDATVLSLDGSKSVSDAGVLDGELTPDSAAQLGIQVADRLLAKGAQQLLDATRQ